MIYLIYRSPFGSIPRSQALSLGGLVIASVFSPQSCSFRHCVRRTSTFSSPPQDSGTQMAKNKAKGIKRKGPKTASLDRGKSSQAGQDQRMSQRNNYQSDQARDRLESALRDQQAAPQQQIPPGGGGYTAMSNFSQGTNPYNQAWGGWSTSSHQLAPPGAYGQWTSTPSVPPPIRIHSNTRSFVNSAYNNDKTSYNNNNDNAPERRGHSTSSHPGQKQLNYNHQLPPKPNSQPNNNNLQLPSKPSPQTDNLQLPTKPNPQTNNLELPSKPKARPHRPHQRKAPHDRDAILPPSAKSGGVPSPTPAYLLRASFLPRAIPNPRPILVVIDLNGTMLFRPSRKQPFNFVERPYARHFLNYCISTFTVAIWSSARPDNVEKMCSQLLTPEQLEAVVAIWGRDKFGLTPTDYNARAMCYKRLVKLWQDPAVAASHPDGEPWNQGNTVLIDDTEEKARSEPYNAITLSEFQGDVNEEPPVLPLVHDYLNELTLQADVSTYIRTNPFKLGGQETDAIDAPEDAIAPATGGTGIQTETGM